MPSKPNERWRTDRFLDKSTYAKPKPGSMAKSAPPVRHHTPVCPLCMIVANRDTNTCPSCGEPALTDSSCNGS